MSFTADLHADSSRLLDMEKLFEIIVSNTRKITINLFSVTNKQWMPVIYFKTRISILYYIGLYSDWGSETADGFGGHLCYLIWRPSLIWWPSWIWRPSWIWQPSWMPLLPKIKFTQKNKIYPNFFFCIYLLVMPKYWVKNYFAHGRFPEVGQKQKTEEKKKRRDWTMVTTMAKLRMAHASRLGQKVFSCNQL